MQLHKFRIFFFFTKSIAISEYNLREQHRHLCLAEKIHCSSLLYYPTKNCIQFQNNLDSNMSTAICALSRAYLKQVIKAHMSFLIRGPIVLPWDLLLCSFALRRLTQSYTSVFFGPTGSIIQYSEGRDTVRST